MTAIQAKLSECGQEARFDQAKVARMLTEHYGLSPFHADRLTRRISYSERWRAQLVWLEASGKTKEQIKALLLRAIKDWADSTNFITMSD